MAKIKHSLFILFFIFSCQDKIKINYTIYSDIILDTLKMENLTVSGKPLFYNKNEIIEHYGHPTNISKNCCSYINRHYDCWRYKTSANLIFYVNDSIGFLQFVNFIDDEHFKINHPNIQISNNTTIKEIKKKFPNSFKYKNTNLPYDQYRNYERFYFKSGVFNNGIEKLIVLRFKNGKLRNFELI